MADQARVSLTPNPMFAIWSQKGCSSPQKAEVGKGDLGGLYRSPGN